MKDSSYPSKPAANDRCTVFSRAQSEYGVESESSPPPAHNDSSPPPRRGDTRHLLDLDLSVDNYGRLILILDGLERGAVTPLRAFPISAPDGGIALVDADGIEQVWLDTLDALSPNARQLLSEVLAEREFTPVITRLLELSSPVAPSQWLVETDRGRTWLSLKAEDDIRRLSDGTLLITDQHGVSYLLRDVTALDRHSRRLLDHFL